MNKQNLIRELKQIISEEAMLNYRGIEIRRFVTWPKNVDFNSENYILENIISDFTDPQKEIKSNDLNSGNFQILECSNDGTFKIQSLDYCIDLYNHYKNF